MGVYGALFLVSGGGWKSILGGWGWMGKFLGGWGLLGMSVGEWGWVHCLIMPNIYL